MKTKKRTIKDALREKAAGIVGAGYGLLIPLEEAVRLEADAATAGARRKMLAKPPGEKQQAQAKKLPGRLPDGAMFVLLYSAVTKMWVGSLKIGDVVFSEKNCGRFKLMRVLDAQYRKSLAPVAEKV